MSKKYAKLIDGGLIFAPSSIEKTGPHTVFDPETGDPIIIEGLYMITNYNAETNEAMLLEDGYKPYVIEAQPTEIPDGYSIEWMLIETPTEITKTCEFIELPPAPEPTPEQILQAGANDFLLGIMEGYNG